MASPVSACRTARDVTASVGGHQNWHLQSYFCTHLPTEFPETSDRRVGILVELTDGNTKRTYNSCKIRNTRNIIFPHRSPPPNKLKISKQLEPKYLQSRILRSPEKNASNTIDWR
ncbi:hypothetical protein CCP2SC5_1300002 [Azospirillaceae bacterium]